MNIDEMKEFVNQRIDSVEKKDVNEGLVNTNGILIHFIPENLLDGNPLDWNNGDHKFKIKHSFRRLSGLDTQYSDLGDKILSYTPNNEYYICFQNGITETFRHPIENQNSLDGRFNYIKVENLFYAIRDFIEASKAVHDKLYKTIPPYHIFISLLGIQGAYFASFDKNYTTTIPFPGKNVRFESFQLNSLSDNIMPEIINGIHYGIRATSQWKPIK
jgi:hypothetical protein